jgi:hypothetical protein
MSVCKINASTELTSGTPRDEVVDEEEAKWGQPELMDGPKIGVMSSWSELPLPSVLTLVDAVGIERLTDSERPRVYRCRGAGGTKSGGTWGPMLLVSSSDSTIPESRGRYFFSNLDVA